MTYRETMARVGDRAVLTLAVGKPAYVAMAVNLARSFLFWNRPGDIRFALATDQPHLVPLDLATEIEIIAIAPGQYGRGFSPKLHLDRLQPADRTLFIDGDSLVVGRLDDCFDAFANRDVAVIGESVSDGEWFGDVGTICRTFGISALPRFIGGVYYLERGPGASKVYECARALEARYDELRLVRLRGVPNEEILVAIAMAMNGYSAIADDGTIKAEPSNFPCGIEIDALRGVAVLRNTPGHPNYKATWPLREARPRIVHFLGYHVDRVPYTSEAMRLELVTVRRWPRWVASIAASARHTIPERATTTLKDVFRPAFHRVFGARPIVPTSKEDQALESPHSVFHA